MRNFLGPAFALRILMGGGAGSTMAIQILLLVVFISCTEINGHIQLYKTSFGRCYHVGFCQKEPTMTAQSSGAGCFLCWSTVSSSRTFEIEFYKYTTCTETAVRRPFILSWAIHISGTWSCHLVNTVMTVREPGNGPNTNLSLQTETTETKRLSRHCKIPPGADSLSWRSEGKHWKRHELLHPSWPGP